MESKNTKIFILENEIPFRDRLQSLCSEMGKTCVAGDVQSALELMTRDSFGLLLLDWNLIQPDFSDFCPVIDNFQADVPRMALFMDPQLNDVIAAMKSGMSDVLWAHQNSAVLKDKIRDCLSLEKTPAIAHSYVSQWVESLTDRAMAQKTSFYKARKEFSKNFLRQILNQRKMRRFQLADVMRVAPRTLHRHLSK